MGKIAIVTDSNSGITQDQARELGISVIPMPFYINEKLYLEGITLSQEEFYERLKNDEAISTSQPGPADVCGLWNTLLEKYDEVVHIPMSSGLSASCDTAMGLAQEYDGRVHVVDNQRISVTQRQSVLDALTLRDVGRNATQIKQVLEEQKLDAYSKTRGKKQAKRVMLKAMQNDWENRFAEYVKRGEMCLQSAYTGNQEEAEEFKKEIAEVFPGIEIVQNPLSLSVACHIGHGAIAVACSRKVVVE